LRWAGLVCGEVSEPPAPSLPALPALSLSKGASRREFIDGSSVSNGFIPRGEVSLRVGPMEWVGISVAGISMASLLFLLIAGIGELSLAERGTPTGGLNRCMMWLTDRVWEIEELLALIG
jgi:hypothetical protein